MLTAIGIKALIIWSGILVLAIANGMLRESVLISAFGTQAALVLSGLLLSAVILGVTYYSLPWLQVTSPAGLFAVGLGWLAHTLVFEFSFGLWQGKSWPELLEAYTFKDGNLWTVVLAVIVLAPYIAAKLRGLI